MLRSDALNRVAPDSLDSLTARDVKPVTDLRTESEAVKDPDPDLAGRQNVRFSPVAEDDDLLTPWLAASMSEAKSLLDAQGGPLANLRATYLKFALPHAVTAFRQLFRALLNADGQPVIIHCTAGQDRTGFAAYTLQRILGVSHEDAIRDYLIGKVNNAPSHKDSIAYLETMGYSPAEASAADEFSEENFAAALHGIDALYGTFDNFVARGLQLTEADTSRLRELYVAG